jgi:hypothetical protein
MKQIVAIEKWLSKFRSTNIEENVYIPPVKKVARTVMPDVRLNFNEQSLYINNQVERLKYGK